MNMCSTSVEPMPSMMSTPNRRLKRSYSAGGSASPADTASRTLDRSQAVPPDNGIDIRGCGRTRPQHARRADGQRKVESVAEPVREKQLRHAEAAIRRPDSEHALGEQLRTDHHVVVQVDAGL